VNTEKAPKLLTPLEEQKQQTDSEYDAQAELSQTITWITPRTFVSWWHFPKFLQGERKSHVSTGWERSL